MKSLTENAWPHSTSGTRWVEEFTAIPTCPDVVEPDSKPPTDGPSVTTNGWLAKLHTHRVLPPSPAMKGTLNSAKHKAARSANLQRRKRLRVELGAIGLGADRVRAVIAESVREAHRQRGREWTGHNESSLVLISCTTGASSRLGLREDRAATGGPGSHIFQGAENLVFRDVDIIAAGGNVERHRHEHIHVHVHFHRSRIQNGVDEVGGRRRAPVVGARRGAGGGRGLPLFFFFLRLTVDPRTTKCQLLASIGLGSFSA
ncbi:hypothetical protein DFP72DRAFT_1124208 [Ephemerocybe angulata]|uniref:Uncharacterized protein n=1 Tax=Ephemerocybe angulata TaxID=980116 RepID=A0A8H6M763_9AGAR|nr:hypothetical protein DFP72DRAFT_1124208 [Tulosesus angulatus]